MTYLLAGDRQASRTQMLGNADLRRHNLSATLRAVHESGQLTRGEVAEATGLTKTAVGGLVADLIDCRVLVETEPASRVGRPSPPLRVAHERFTAAVVDVGATYVTTTVCDLSGRLLHQTTELTGQTPAADSTRLTLERAAEAISHSGDAGRQRVGAVIAVHGVIGGALENDGPRLRARTLLDQLTRSLGARSDLLIVENDANLAALAEWAYHRRNGVSSLVSLSGELSLGAGIVLDGRLHRGAHGLAGRFSHIALDPAGPRCACGRRGCWRTLVGLPEVLRAALPDVARGLEGIPGYAPIAVDALVAAARANDDRAVAALADAGRWLGEGAANIANALDPALIVLGSYFGAVADWIMPTAQDAFDRGFYRADTAGGVLVLSDLATAPYHTGAVGLERSRVVGGGLYSVTERLLADPLRWAVAN